MNHTMESFEFPDFILDQGTDITVKELLDSPVSQAFIVSALANIGRCDPPKDVTHADKFLHFRCQEIVKSIPRNELRELFTSCAKEVRSRIKQRDERKMQNIELQQPELPTTDAA